MKRRMTDDEARAMFAKITEQFESAKFDRRAAAQAIKPLVNAWADERTRADEALNFMAGAMQFASVLYMRTLQSFDVIRRPAIREPVENPPPQWALYFVAEQVVWRIDRARERAKGGTRE